MDAAPELITVSMFSNTAEAELARERLGQEGIEAFVIGTVTAHVVPHLPQGGGVALQVAPESAEEAREILGVPSV